MEESKEESEDLFSALLERLSSCHWGNGSDELPTVDETRARNLLEASAGNLDLAVMLYWEDLAVSNSNLANEDNMNFHEDNNLSEVSNSNLVNEYVQAPNNRRVRRRLSNVRSRRASNQPASAANMRANFARMLDSNDLDRQEPDVEPAAVQGSDLNSISDDEGVSVEMMRYSGDENEDSALQKPEAGDTRHLTLHKDQEVLLNDSSVFDSSPLKILWGDKCDKKNVAIPEQWLDSGFILSPCCSGLIGNASYDEPQRRNKHKVTECKGVSALLSIVTALLQSGASLQGSHEVHCGLSRTRFADLKTEQEKRKQFKSRLADALSSLLYLAASSKANKKKTTLCPVCIWGEEQNSEETTRPPSSAIGQAISTSKTNLRDLRSFVFSNIHSFTSRGGCALFLETVIRIHGPKAIMSATNESLIKCSCEQKTVKEVQRHDCISVELVSLLLTGTIHTSLQGDLTTGGLGIGVLGCKCGNPEIDTQVGANLMNPTKPVWIIIGEHNYSTLWLKDQSQIHYMLYPSSTAFYFTHWDSIFKPSGRCTHMRVIPCRTISLKDSSTEITPQELDTIIFHPSDQIFYPDDYRRWRFKINQSDSSLEDAEISKIGSNQGKTKDESTLKQCIPYFRLDPRQKILADSKYATRIHTVIWSKWPEAVVDDFTLNIPPIV